MAKIKLRTQYLLPTHADYSASLDMLVLYALKSGAKVQPSGVGFVEYSNIDNDLFLTDYANLVMSLEGNSITEYSIQRYIAVSDLSTDLPVEIPESSITDIDTETTRQLTWQEVQDSDSVNAPLRDGNYYFGVMAHKAGRGLTLDEFNACAGLTLLTADELPAPAPVDEP